MHGWRTKIFGNTSFNFYGWIFGGLLILGVSTREVVLAFRSDSGLAIEHHLLFAIWILLIGQFSMAMQNYCTRVAKELDEKDRKK